MEIIALTYWKAPPFYSEKHRRVSTARVGTQEIEEVWEVVHGDGIVGFYATRLVPVFREGDVILANHRV